MVAPEGLQVAGFKLTPLQGKNSWPTTATLTLRRKRQEKSRKPKQNSAPAPAPQLNELIDNLNWLIGSIRGAAESEECAHRFSTGFCDWPRARASSMA